MKRISLIILFILSITGIRSQKPVVYKDKNVTIKERVEDLLKRMTLEEKVAQLQCKSKFRNPDEVPTKGLGFINYVFGNEEPKAAAEKFNRLQEAFINKTRLGIPVLYHGEAVYGLMGNGNTNFPLALAQAATFNPDLHAKMATAIAEEVKARGHRHVLSPVLNVAYDSRWGRTQETYGEDPYLVTKMGLSYIQPMEQAGVATTPKHFAANIGHDGKFGGPIYYSERFFREVEFPPFKAAVQEGKCSAIMAAYNPIDGIPCAANQWLLTDILRNEWKFDGIVVSDYSAVILMYENFYTAKDSADAGIQALNAGLDVELTDIAAFGAPLMNALKEGKIKEDVIDRSVRRVLYLKFKIGLFESPYADPEKAEKLCNSKEHRAISREIAEESITLLKNKNVLPFNKNIKSIAVLGPLGNSYITNHYAGYGTKRVTIVDGIREKMDSKTAILVEKGVELTKTALPSIPTGYLFHEENGTLHNGLKGEYFSNMDLKGEPALVRVDETIDFDWGEGIPHPFLKADHFSVRWTGYLESQVSGKFKIGITVNDGGRLFFNGKRVINDFDNSKTRLSETEIELEKGVKYPIRFEYVENEGNATAKLGWNIFSANIQNAVELAKKADAVVICVGAMDNEGADRADLDLSKGQVELIKAVAALHKPFVVILTTGTVITMADWVDDAPAILEAWYPGQEGGYAVADILFGDANPGGKLPITFPKATGQLPCYYHAPKNTSSTSYVGVGNSPLFPFGFGLSYTTFEYSNLKVSKNSIHAEDSITVSLDIKNTGKMKGDEVVQLYVHDQFFSVQRPAKLLRGFSRVRLGEGESKSVTFTLSNEDLGMYDRKMKWVVEPGKFDILIGSSSEDIRLKSEIEVKE
jgi:beta-glucosidase